ncbi:MAG: WecB/TagA/CpsF family glycosyltransferase [Alkalinema sp. CAN_BIN05]|nr:WecB/TagA/CpsF family glycosyltransferase [Alkalinema sp. CAN_BIN05]
MLQTQPIREKILKSSVDCTTYKSVCDRLVELTTAKQSGYVIAANVHVVMTAFWNRDYRSVVNGATIVTPDGMPIVFGLRLLGHLDQTRVYGPDLMLAWCDRASGLGLPIYLYGSSWETLRKLQDKLSNNFPGLQIAGSYSPPFRTLTSEETQQDCDRINASRAAVVFVALGCPKQEFWMAQNQSKIQAVTIGVGAAFRFHTGEVSQAPKWMMRCSLEWLYRLIMEPRRLWKRYVINNPAFVILFGWQWLRSYLKGKSID